MTKDNNNQPVDKTELVWPGKRREVERVELPFQTIETINLPRGARQDDLFEKFGQEGWKNRLIWGDNLLVMGSLLKDFAGKINLIYIDPPFATGDDFSFTVNIGDQAEITKEPSALEVKAYRDTWGKGMQSYLQMMYDRLVLMKELLADDGTVWVHVDHRVLHYLKVLMDEIFGKDNFRNQVTWRRQVVRGMKTHSEFMAFSADYLLIYSKTDNVKWHNIEKETFISIEEAEKKYQKDERGYFRTSDRGTYSNESIIKLAKEGRIYVTNGGRLIIDEKNKKVSATKGSIAIKYYREKVGDKVLEKTVADNIWDDIPGMGVVSGEWLGYPTQKPANLLERVIKSSTDEGDLVADFFCGSGTTGVVAEKIGRRWIMCDLGRFAIHTTRKRLLDIGAKPFVVQNLGKYERHRWAVQNGFDDNDKNEQQKKYIRYLENILELYHAEPIDGFTNLHGKKGNTFVRVGSVDAPVTLSEIREALEECKENNIKKLDVLGWEWEMGLHDLVKEEAEKYGVKLATLQIPREVMDISPAEAKKHDIQFFELAYLEVEPRVDGKRVTITLKDFIIPNPELLPEDVKGKVKSWSDFIDYWAVDWMFNQHEEKTEEDDTFHNMNQRYRTRKEPKLELSMDYEYKKAGKYNVLVKVIDIFGNDTTKLVEVKV